MAHLSLIIKVMSHEDIEDITDIIVGYDQIIKQTFDEINDQDTVKIKIEIQRSGNTPMFFEFSESEYNTFEKHGSSLLKECLSLFKFERS